MTDTETPREQAVRILREAADTLERRGLFQGWYIPPELSDHENAWNGMDADYELAYEDSNPSECPLCTLGAINLSACGDPEDSSWQWAADTSFPEVVDNMSRAFSEVTWVRYHPDGLFAFATYNDVDGMTAGIMAGKLREAATRLG